MKHITSFLIENDYNGFSLRGLQKQDLDWLGFYPIVDEFGIVIDIIDMDNFGWITETKYEQSGSVLINIYGMRFEFDSKLEAYV